MDLAKTWGIHSFKGESEGNTNFASYFLERPFGNILIFSLPEKLGSKETLRFIESKGGLACQMDISPKAPNLLQKLAYQRFGAPILLPTSTPALVELVESDYSFRYAVFGQDFYQASVQYKKLDEDTIIHVYQRELDFYFFPETFFLDRGVIKKDFNTFEIDKLKQLSHFKKESVFFFRFFRGSNFLLF